jgi:hypothetical protein
MARRPIEIECVEVWRHISDYIDDAVDPELRNILLNHFKGCAHCTAVLDGSRNVVRLMGDGKAFDLPAQTSKRLYLKLDEYLGARQNGSKN